MRIALFTHVCDPFTNGVATSVEQLAKQLRQRGHDVIIVSNNYDKFGNSNENDKIKVRSVPIFYQNLRTPVLVNPKLFKLLSEYNIDLIHSHSDFGLALLGREYAYRHNIPLIQTYHCNYLEYARENFGKASYYFFYEPVKLYTKALCKTANRVIVPSKATKTLLEDKFNINRNFDLIPNGIDFDKFNGNEKTTKELKESLGLSEDDFVLLSVSRLSKEKRIDDIIRLMPLLKECEKLKLVIVGGGPEENKLKRMSQDLNLNNIIFTGEIPFSNIQNYYQLGDLFITNSVAETQALTPIEALASSLPCIVPNVPIYQDLINGERNGFLYNNEEELTRIIRDCYDNREYLMNRKEIARESVLDYSIDSSVKKIEDLYVEEKGNCLRKSRLKYKED